MVSMKSVNLSEAKATLSRLVRYVARGEVVIILSHGRPVARLSAPTAADNGLDDARLAALEREGIVRRGTRPASLDFLKAALAATLGRQKPAGHVARGA